MHFFRTKSESAEDATFIEDIIADDTFANDDAFEVINDEFHDVMTDQSIPWTSLAKKEPIGNSNAKVLMLEKLKLIKAQRKVAETQIEINKERLKAEKVINFYKVQEAISAAKNAGYEPKDGDPKYKP